MSSLEVHLLRPNARLGLILTVLSASALAQQYSVSPINVPGLFTPYALNNNGAILGDQQDHILQNIILVTNTGIVNFGDALQIQANGLNDANQVVGSHPADDGQYHAFVYQDGVFTDIAPAGSNAFGINQAGQITGLLFGTANDGAFLYSNGSLTNIYPIQDPNYYAYGFSINSQGDVAGAKDRECAFCTDSVGFYWDSTTDTAMELGDLGYGGAVVRGLNDSGLIVGSALSANNWAYPRAVIFNKDGSVQDLGSLNGLTTSRARGVNNSGTIVGQCGGNKGLAFVYDSQQGMVDLNTLIPSNSGWSLEDATAINDNGQIVGVGKLNGQPKAFLLTPN